MSVKVTSFRQVEFDNDEVKRILAAHLKALGEKGPNLEFAELATLSTKDGDIIMRWEVAHEACKHDWIGASSPEHFGITAVCRKCGEKKDVMP